MARERGHHEASHVVWIGKSGWKDWELKRILLDEDWVLVTKNSEDFRGPRSAPGTKGQYAYVSLHAGLVCLNGPVGMDLALQRELFSHCRSSSFDKRGWTPATRNRYRDAFSLVFRKALENHVLTVNPATLVKAKPEHNERVRFLSATEETKLLAALQKEWAQHVPAFLVSIHTGMRAGEQFQLKWRDVSLERRLVSLPKTKSGKARHIPLNAVACNALLERKRAQQDQAANQKEKGKEHADQVYVFRDAGRDPQHNYRRWFNEALTDAKIKDYSWHCNRHTFASRLVMAGVDLRTVAELMGHNSIQMTMRYAHLAPQHNRAAVDLLVPVSETRQTRKAAKCANELVTKSVTSKKEPSRRVAKNRNKARNNSDLQTVAP